MAKYIEKFQGNLEDLKKYLEKNILDSSLSASLEENYETEKNGVNCSIQVYERFSFSGSNRVSLHITMLEFEEQIELIAVTSGGSQAVIWKINTWGEETFWDQLKQILKEYKENVTGNSI